MVSLTEMLAVRRNGGRSGVAKLTSFRLSLASTTHRAVVEEAISKLRSLRNDGLEMVIHSAPKWSTERVNSRMVGFSSPPVVGALT